MNDLFSSLPATVDFHGTGLVTMWRDDKPYVAVKPISDALGLDWEAQRQRIQRDTVLSKGTCITQVASNGGPQPTVFLPLGMIPGWLFGISDRRVRPELRNRIVEYKSECYDVLAKHFYGKATPKQPLPAPDTVQVRSYTRRKAISPAVKNYTEILEVALSTFASTASVLNPSLKELDRMKYFKDALVGVLKLAVDMERAGAPREEVLATTQAGAFIVGYDCVGGRFSPGSSLDFPKCKADSSPVKDLIAKGLMAPRT